MRAIILAGGRGSRLRRTAAETPEKALITLNRSGSKRKLIDIVVGCVRQSRLDEVCVAVTSNTPQTASYCQQMEYETITTPGAGYIADLWFLLRSYPAFISVACDLPFLRPAHINALIDAYALHQSSITGAVPVSLLPDGITPGHTFIHEGTQLVACGLNVVTASEASVPFVFDEPLLALNVNTPADLRMARQLVSRDC